MERWNGRVAVVTGASAGIGAAIAKLLCQNGMKVVACARRIEKIQEIFGSEETKAKQLLHPYKCDLENFDEIRTMFEWIENEPELGRVDICIPNAGLSANTSLLDGNVDEWRQMLNVNVIALNLCTQLAVRSMIKHKIDDGQIVMLNSMSGHRVPTGSPTKFYSATKFAVTALLEGWRQEIRALGPNHIRVAQVSPGVVETEFSFAMNPGKPEKAEKLYSSMLCIQAKDIADSVLHIIAAPIHVQIHDILVRPTEQAS